MRREATLARTLVRLADTLVADSDVVELLTLVTDCCVEVLDVASAGIMSCARCRNPQNHPPLFGPSSSLFERCRVSIGAPTHPYGHPYTSHAHQCLGSANTLDGLILCSRPFGSMFMELVDLSDPDLLAQLCAAAEDVQRGADSEHRRDAWHRVTTLLREFERRYPRREGTKHSNSPPTPDSGCSSTPPNPAPRHTTPTARAP